MDEPGCARVSKHKPLTGVGVGLADASPYVEVLTFITILSGCSRSKDSRPSRERKRILSFYALQLT